MPKWIAKSAVISVFLLLTTFLLPGPSFAEGNVCDGCVAGFFNDLPACIKDGHLHICENNFPDRNLRKFLTAQYDRDGDALLTKAQINGIIRLDCSWQGVHSLEGIAYFSNLEDLYCPYNQLTELDLTANRKLQRIDCSGNHLESLNVPKEGLQLLHCSGNSIRELDLSNTNLKEVDCAKNQLTSLNLSGSQISYLYCNNNKLTSLDLSGQFSLYSLNCSENQLENLILSDTPELISLFCESNKLRELDLSNLRKLDTLQITGNRLSKIDLSMCMELAFVNLGSQISDTPTAIQTYSGTEECTVDLASLVGSSCTGNIINVKILSLQRPIYSYNATTGILKFKDYVSEIRYAYQPDITSPKLAGHPTMQVSVSLSCNHTWTTPTCSTPAICTGCGEESCQYAPHSMRPATATHPESCSFCGYYEESSHPLEHVWIPASCTAPEHCKFCDVTIGSPLEHEYDDEICGITRYCHGCRKAIINTEKHEWEFFTCGLLKCKKCGTLDKTEKIHTWSEPGLFTRAHCLYCSETGGSSYIGKYFFVILAVQYALELTAAVWYLLDYKRERKY